MKSEFNTRVALGLMMMSAGGWVAADESWIFINGTFHAVPSPTIPRGLEDYSETLHAPKWVQLGKGGIYLNYDVPAYYDSLQIDPNPEEGLCYRFSSYNSWYTSYGYLNIALPFSRYNSSKKECGDYSYGVSGLIQTTEQVKFLTCQTGAGPTGGRDSKCASYYFIETPPAKPSNSACDKEGNPCDPVTGAKTQTEVDVVLPGGFSFERYYSSQNTDRDYRGLGGKWRHSYVSSLERGLLQPITQRVSGEQRSSFYATPESACTNGWGELMPNSYGGLLSGAAAIYQNGICLISDGNAQVAVGVNKGIPDAFPMPDATRISVNQPSGNRYTFVYSGGWVEVNQQPVSLAKIGDEWIFTATDGAVEVFNSRGLMTSRRDLGGRATTFTYDSAGNVMKVTFPNGRTLSFTYGAYSRISKVSFAGGSIGYAYDGASGTLIKVTYQDGKTRRYLYEDGRFPHHLTGIVDENNERYATWSYDVQGRVVSSEHAGGAERVSLTYNADGTTTVMDALGAKRVYQRVMAGGDAQVARIDGDRCSTCAGGGVRSRIYDANGYLASKTDWNGITTTYTHDAQGRELSRTEAAGTPEARTVTTEWHSQWRLPVRISEPGKVIVFTYDDKGQLLSRNETAAP